MQLVKCNRRYYPPPSGGILVDGAYLISTQPNVLLHPKLAILRAIEKWDNSSTNLHAEASTIYVIAHEEVLR